PLGKRRLLEDLKAGLQDARFTDFRLVVAYAKTGPLYRLQELLEQWRRDGKTSSAILGFDQQGTSKEALELALSLFDSVYVVQEAGITFHPKIYLFKGEHHAEVFIGSNNLTVGGTEKNFETAIDLELDLPTDSAYLNLLETSWSELLPDSCSSSIQLNSAGLAQLTKENLVVAETAMYYGPGRGNTTRIGRARRSGLLVKPESPLPKARSAALAAITQYPSTQPIAE
ncbi:MAG: phospholipase D family protein, partial [Gammaproteobacteria bacterium]|nr:phospholipase D family protein [Gammaproteobacteria bacterium]